MSLHADFYHDETGADALRELEALDNPESSAVGKLLGRMGAVMSQVSRRGTGAFYHAERWGQLYLVNVDDPPMYLFVRYAPDAATPWMVLMAGEGTGDNREVQLTAMVRMLASKELRS